jgi:hypothetical protein
MVPGRETLQLQECRWYGTRQRNIAAAGVPLVWYQAGKHYIACPSVAVMPDMAVQTARILFQPSLVKYSF